MSQTTSRGLSDAFRPTHRSLGKRPMVEEDTLDTSHKRIRIDHNNSSAMVNGNGGIEQSPYLGGPVQPPDTPVAQVAPQQNIRHPQDQMRQQGYGNPPIPADQNHAPYPMWTANNVPGVMPPWNNHQIPDPGPMWTGNNIPEVIAQCNAQDHVHIVYWVLNNFAHFQHDKGVSSCDISLVPLENVPHTGIITVPRIIRDTWKAAQPSQDDDDNDNDNDNDNHNDVHDENPDADNDNENDAHDGNPDADDSAHNDNFEDVFAQNDNLEAEFAHNDNLEDALALSLTAFLESDDQIPEL